MTDQPEDRIGKDTRRFTLYGVVLRDILLMLACLAFIGVCIVSVWAIRKYNSREDDRQKNIWTPLQETVANFKDASENAKRITAGAAQGSEEIAPTLRAVRARVEALAPAEANLAALESRFDRETAALSASVQARLQRVDGFVGEARHQLKQNGDALHDTVLSLNDAVKEGSLKFGKLADDGSQLVETTSKQTGALLSHLDAVVVDIDGTILAVHPILDNTAATTKHIEGITGDLQTWAHGFLVPPPVKGFWPKTLRVLKMAVLPATDAAKLYFTLRPIP